MNSAFLIISTWLATLTVWNWCQGKNQWKDFYCLRENNRHRDEVRREACCYKDATDTKLLDITRLRGRMDALENEVHGRAKHVAAEKKAIIKALGGTDGPRWTLGNTRVDRDCDCEIMKCSTLSGSNCAINAESEDVEPVRPSVSVEVAWWLN